MKGMAESCCVPQKCYKEKETNIKKKNPKLKELKHYNLRKNIPVTKSKPNNKKEQKKLPTRVSKNNTKKFVAVRIMNMKGKTKLVKNSKKKRVTKKKWKLVGRKRNLQVEKTKVTKDASWKRKLSSCSVDMDVNDTNKNLKLAEEKDVLNRITCKNGLQEKNDVSLKDVQIKLQKVETKSKSMIKNKTEANVTSKNGDYSDSSDTSSDNELPEAFTPRKTSVQGKVLSVPNIVSNKHISNRIGCSFAFCKTIHANIIIIQF